MTEGAQAAVREYRIGQDESQRIRILKIWLTVMVVFIHSYTEAMNYTEGTLVLSVPVWLDWLKYLLSQVVARCAVPGFFLLAGALLYRKSFTWGGNLRKKARTLLVPYLLINTVWIAVFFTAQHISAFSGYFSQPDNIVADWSVRDWLHAYTGFCFLADGNDMPFVYPLWFMRDLMVLNVLAPALKKLIDRFPRLMLLSLAALALFGDGIHVLVMRPHAVVFFCLGYYLVKYDIHLTDADKLDPVLLAGFYGLSVALDCVMRDSPWQHLARLFSIVLGIAFFFRFTTAVKSPVWKRRLLALAGWSLPIYLLHELTLTSLKKVLVRLLPSSPIFQTLEYFGVPAVIICLCIAVSWVLKKWLPRLYAVLTGGRTM